MQNGLINGDAAIGRRPREGEGGKEEEKTQTSNYAPLRRLAALRVAAAVVVVLIVVCLFLSGSHFIGLCTLSLLVKMSQRDGNWWQAAVIFRRPNDVQGAREAVAVNSSFARRRSWWSRRRRLQI